MDHGTSKWRSHYNCSQSHDHRRLHFNRLAAAARVDANVGVDFDR
jgi:hypothetical protein